MKEHTMIRRMRNAAGDKEHVVMLPVSDLDAVDGETVAKDLIVDLYQVVGSIRNFKTMIK